MSETPLDIAQRRMEADDAARLAFYGVLADSELFLLLTGEAQGDAIEPQVVEADGQQFVLAFDREERLADFAGQMADYAVVSGRALAQMLDGQGVGLGLNLDVAPSAVLLPDTAVSWLAGMLQEAPEEGQGKVQDVLPPALPAAVIATLDARLARAAGLAKTAWLCGARFADGRSGHLLAILGAVPGAETALAKSIGEALVFSGVEDGTIDVTFLPDNSEMVAPFTRVGLRFDLPEPEQADEVQVPGSAPGMDPSKPPILK